MLLAINPATFAFLPVALAGAYLLYKLWAPSQGVDHGLPIDVKEGQPDSRPGGALSTYETFLPDTFISTDQTHQTSFDSQEHAQTETIFGGTSTTTPLYPVEHLPGSVLFPAALGEQSPGKESADTHDDPVFPGEETPEADFTLEGLFSQVGTETKDAEEKPSQPIQHDQPEKKERRATKRGGLRNTVAQFPFDVRAWENPGSPKSVVRAQRRAEKAEKAQRINETRVTVQDVASKGESLVLLQPAELPKEMFADVWELASGQAAPDALVTEGIDEKTAKRAAKRAEREERKLNKLQSKQERREAKKGPEKAPDDSFYVETEDPWATDSAGQGAYIDSGSEVGAPVEWISSEEEPGATTWVVGDVETNDALVTEGIDEKTAKRAAKRAEREERKLNKLQSKQERREAKKGPEKAPDDSFYVETEDPWATDSAGQGAYIDSGSEVGAPVEWISSEEEPGATTWVVGGEGLGMGDKATTWEAAAASVGPLVPSATMITGEELLEIGSSIVIGTEPGAGDGAFYLPEGFEAIEVEAEGPRKRRLGRKKREEDEETAELESVSDWAQGGVVLDPDEGVNYQDYDIPEPIPSRTVILFGESEES